VNATAQQNFPDACDGDPLLRVAASEESRILAQLARVPPGAYDVNVRRSWWRWWQPKERGGWLTVSRDDEGRTDVMWTSEKDTHWPYGEFGCARSVMLGANGTLVAYFESALSMRIKWGYGRGDDAQLGRAMDFATWAHGRLCGMRSGH